MTSSRIPGRLDEAAMQKMLVGLLGVAACPDVEWWHTPNGEARNPITGSRLKAMGVRPGIPDLAFVIAGRAHFLELKKPGGRLNPAQKERIPALQRAGAIVEVVDDLDTAVEILRAWGVLREARSPTTQEAEQC